METTLLHISSDYGEDERTRRAFGILSGAWAIPVINYLDAEGESGFNNLKRKLRSVTSKTLSKTLNSLLEKGIVDRKVIPAHPPRVVYSLSGKGAELVRLLYEFRSWEQKWQDLLISSPEIPTAMN